MYSNKYVQINVPGSKNQQVQFIFKLVFLPQSCDTLKSKESQQKEDASHFF